MKRHVSNNEKDVLLDFKKTLRGRGWEQKDVLVLFAEAGHPVPRATLGRWKKRKSDTGVNTPSFDNREKLASCRWRSAEWWLSR